MASSMSSKQMLEALQDRLADVGMDAFFSSGNNHILLDVYCGPALVTVGVASTGSSQESFAWTDPGGRFHQESPDGTLAWFRNCANSSTSRTGPGASDTAIP